MGTIKLSTLIGQSQADIIKALNQEVVQPWHDCADSIYTTASKQSVTGGSNYDFHVDGVSRNETNLPTHITKLWDTAENLAVFSEVLDTPVYVARVQLTFLPGTAAEGYMEFKAYVNETVPVLLQTIRVAYKTDASRMEALFAFYTGDATGYDIKNKGIFFEYTPKTSGQVYDRGILIYKT